MFKEDILKVVKHLQREGAWVFIGRVYMLLASLMTSVILARVLTEESYGLYKYLTAVMAVSAILSLPEAVQIVIRNVPLGRFYVFRDLLRDRLVFSLVGGFALAVTGALQVNAGDERFGFFLLVFAILFPFYHSLQMYESLLQATMEFRKLNRILIARATVQLLSIVSFAVTFQSMYVATILAAGVSILFSIGVLVSIYRQRKSELGQPRQEEGRAHRSQALYLSLFAVLPVLAEQLDKVLLGELLSFKALALFSIGMTLGTAANGFFKPFMTTISARLVHKELHQRQFLLVLIVGTAMGFAVAALVPWLVHYLYGPRYVGSIEYASVVLKSMGIYFLSTLHYNQSMFFKGGGMGKVYVANFVVPSAAIGCVVWLFNSGLEKPEILFLLALMYPVKLVLSSLVLYAAPRFEYFRKRWANAN